MLSPGIIVLLILANKKQNKTKNI